MTACGKASPTSRLALQVDNRHAKDPVITPEQAAKICDRNFGIGGDGVSTCASCSVAAGGC